MSTGLQGAYPALADGSEVLCCDRSGSGEVLAVGDSMGRLRLFQYPCVVRGPLFHQYQGHSFGCVALNLRQRRLSLLLT